VRSTPAARSLGRLHTLIRREFVELVRDPFSILILTVLPLLLIAMLSYALTTEVRGLRVGVFDADQSQLSSRLIGALRSTNYFQIRRLGNLSQLRSAMASGHISAAVIVPPDFSADLARGRTAQVQVLLDGVETVVAANADGIIEATIAAFQERLRASDPRALYIATGIAPPGGRDPGQIDPVGGNVLALPRSADVADTSASGINLSRAHGVGPIRLVQRALFNPKLRVTDFTIPGLIGFITTFLCILTTALAIVRERQAGTFEQLRVTPVRTIEIILGKILPLGFVYLVDTCLLMLLGYFLFDLTPRGSVLLLLAVTALYLLTNLCAGLFISSIAETPDRAVQMTVLVVVPQLSLSGLIFPIHSMPAWARALTEAVPLAHYLRVIRGIYLTGSGLADFWKEVLVLCVFLALSLVAVDRNIEKLKV
jgi:ABC-2 type transport system permease protein